MRKCGKACEVYSRIVGYYRPVQQWNKGKKEEFRDRLEYSEGRALKRDSRKRGKEVGRRVGK